MLEIIGLVFSSIFSGGATGLMGAAAQRYADYKNKELDIQLEKQRGELELAKREKDAQIMAQEWAGRTRVADIERVGAESVADANAFSTSFALEPKRYAEGVVFTQGQAWVMVLTDTFRGIVRPLLTIYLCVLTTMIYVQARALLSKEDLDVSQALELEKLIVGTVLYLTTTCVLWWFGTRNKQNGLKI